MKNSFWHILYILLLAVLAVLLHLCVSENNSKTDSVVQHTTDTVFLSKVDTIPAKPKLITKRIVDTLYIAIEKNDTTDSVLGLPIEQKHYAEDSVYDIWVSGVTPNLDSANVYQKTEFITITNETIKEIYPKRNELYLQGGLSVSNGTLMPKISISLKTKKDWIITPEIGLYGDKMFYGISIGKKIN